MNRQRTFVVKHILVRSDALGTIRIKSDLLIRSGQSGDLVRIGTYDAT